MSEAFASAWSLMKAPIYEPDFDLEPGFTVWDMPPHEEERQQQFNHLFPNYMKTPLQGETYGGWVMFIGLQRTTWQEVLQQSTRTVFCLIVLHMVNQDPTMFSCIILRLPNH